MRHPLILLALLLPPAVAADETPLLGVRAVAFSPDGKLLAAGTGEPREQGTVTVWDVATARVRLRHAEKTGVPGVAFSPDGKTLAIASYDNAARLIDVATGKVRATFAHPKEVRSVAFSPDGKRLATACWDGALRLWDVASGKVAKTFTGHKGRIFTVAFSPDGKKLVSAAGNGGVKLWDVASGKELRTLPSRSYFRCADFSPDGRWVLSGDWGGTLRVWDAEKGTERARFSGIGGVDGFAFSAPAHTLAVCSNGRDVALFDLTFRSPGREDLARFRSLVKELEDDSYTARVKATGRLREMGFLIEGQLHKESKESHSAEVRIRTRWVRQKLLGEPHVRLKGHTDELEAAAFTPDGKLLATGGKDGTVRLWNVKERKEVARLLPGR
jgi:WD40 repeat protein